MLDLVEGEVKRGEFGKGVETFDVRNQVIVEVNLSEGRRGIIRYGDGFYAILAKAETLRRQQTRSQPRKAAIPSSA